MNIGLVTILMFVGLVVLLSTGLPIVFCLGGVAVLTAVLLWGPESLVIFASNIFGYSMTIVLIALPLFIFMAMVLERSGIADDLYGMMHNWLGGIKGGLAMGTIIVCTVFAAMSGISGAATTTMGLIALPSMLRRNYDKSISMGCIAAGGALGILIPPSVMMIIYALVAGESVGKLFAGGMLSGLLLSTLFIIYIGIRCFLNPSLGPVVPVEQRVRFREKLVSTRAIIMPLLLVVAVLGSILGGIATPTEAAAVGSLGAVACAAIKRRVNWLLLKEVCYRAMLLTSMIMWIAVVAISFSSIYSGLGAKELIEGLVTAFAVNRYVIVAIMMLLMIVMGTFLDASGIIFICTPIFVPIITALGFDPVWYGILFVINMEMGFLTPPYGINLFYLKGVVPEGITMGDIYRSVLPFVGVQAIGMILIIIFPQIALWLPSQLITR